MADRIIGNTLKGRMLKTDGGDGDAKAIEIDVTGDGSGADLATSFIKFVGATSASGEDGSSPVTAVDVTNNAKLGGILVSVNGVKGWLPIYATA